MKHSIYRCNYDGVGIYDGRPTTRDFEYEISNFIVQACGSMKEGTAHIPRYRRHYVKQSYTSMTNVDMIAGSQLGAHMRI